MARYGKMHYMGQFNFRGKEIPPNATHVVVHTERGLELAEIVAPYCHSKGTCTLTRESIEQYKQASGGADYPITTRGRVERFATEQDINEQRHLDINAKKELLLCNELIRKYKLPMKLVDAEHIFGGGRIIYYFMAEGRVDFRQLVKELAQQYQTRIEMRQIGSRDEARLVADYETCGQECCCRRFLKVLQPVNMRMAKLQKATLDPTKISGRCGRLKCCLRYEDQVYTQLQKKLPRKGTCVLTEAGYGTVIDRQIITQLVKIRLSTDKIIAVNVDEIIDRNYKPPQEGSKTENNKKQEQTGKNLRYKQEHPNNQQQPEQQQKYTTQSQQNNDNQNSQRTKNNLQTNQKNTNEQQKAPSEQSRRKRRRRKRRKPPGDNNKNN